MFVLIMCLHMISALLFVLFRLGENVDIYLRLKPDENETLYDYSYYPKFK